MELIFYLALKFVLTTIKLVETTNLFNHFILDIYPYKCHDSRTQKKQDTKLKDQELRLLELLIAVTRQKKFLAMILRLMCHTSNDMNFLS